MLVMVLVLRLDLDLHAAQLAPPYPGVHSQV